MRESVFVDTGAWIALADADDAHHKVAAVTLPLVLKDCKSLVTSNMVVSESYLLIQRELGRKASMTFLTMLAASHKILIVYSAMEIEREARGILGKYADQDFSYTDAVSFAIMRNQGITKCFCFHKHFVTAGFTKIP